MKTPFPHRGQRCWSPGSCILRPVPRHPRREPRVDSISRMLTGAIAAAVTPLADGGDDLDEDAIGPLTRFLAERGIDGVLACGTTGEGILLSVPERRRVAERFVEARPGGSRGGIHAGAQSTRRPARTRREVGAAPLAVVAPPYFPLDERALLEHLRAAAEACGPLPFYV